MEPQYSTPRSYERNTEVETPNSPTPPEPSFLATPGTDGEFDKMAGLTADPAKGQQVEVTEPKEPIKSGAVAKISSKHKRQAQHQRHQTMDTFKKAL